MTPSGSQSWPGRNEQTFALLLTAIYAWLILGTLQAHEPWRDEAQAWLIGRDASLRETFSLVRYHGHPALWYLLVRPLARLGMPYSSMGLLHGLIAIGNAFLVLRFAPLPRLTRALFVFSFWMSWIYAIESRVYAIGILLLFLIAWRYPERHARPWQHGLLIALLFNSNLHMAFIAGALTAAFAWETFRSRAWNTRHGWALALMASGALALAWQFDFFRPPADNMHGGRFLWSGSPMEILTGLSDAFFPGVQPPAYVFLAAIAILLLFFYALFTRPIPCGILAVHTGGMALMLWHTTSAARQHGLFVVGAVWALWLAHHHRDSARLCFARWPDFAERRRTALGALNLCLLATLFVGVQIHHRDRTSDFSGTRKMAEFIITQGLERYPVAAHRYAHVNSIAPYFPNKKFWYIGTGEWGTYLREDARHRRAHELSNEEALRLLAEQRIPADEGLLLLTDRPLAPVPAGYRLLYEADDTAHLVDEKCFLYFREPSPRPAAPP